MTKYMNLIGQKAKNAVINKIDSKTKNKVLQKYISLIDRSIHLGASIVGACCGSSPRHIAEIKKLQFYISK